MFEKVNPCHPDKVADRIAGAIIDLAYSIQDNPRIAVEVLIGHGKCHIIAETSVYLDKKEIIKIVKRIAGKFIYVDYQEVPQDKHLSDNQELCFRGINLCFRVLYECNDDPNTEFMWCFS